MNVLLLGSCRQKSFGRFSNILSIFDEISYCHSTKEALQLVNYCLYNTIPSCETHKIFRTPILNKRLLTWRPEYRKMINNADIVVWEIATTSVYQHWHYYLHWIAHERHAEYNLPKLGFKRKQSYEEIEYDIKSLSEIFDIPIIVVSHISTVENTSRMSLVNALSSVCQNIPNVYFLNPIRELNLTYKGNIMDLFEKEQNTNHYNVKGESVIEIIYNNFTKSTLKTFYQI